MLVVLTDSTWKGKRFRVSFFTNGVKALRTVNFGSKKGKTYIDHQDATKKKNWIARHSKLNENWDASGIDTAGFWSRWLLWSKDTKEKAIKHIENKFNVNIVHANEV